MTDCLGREEKDVQREVVRGNLWLYMDGPNFTPEDLLRLRLLLVYGLSGRRYAIL